MQNRQQPHPLGKKAKVLLSSVFGPYARDDKFGSRKINPMELYHNQVTRLQGPFSLRMFHRSFGLMLLQANIEAPCTLLDFPTLDRFIGEISENEYDIIGIGSIIPNVGKVKEMCRLIREHQSKAVIVVGGHIANKEDIEDIIDADHIVKGDGVAWFRKYLGQVEDAPVRHPMALSAFGARTVGYRLSDKPEDTAAILVPSAGCPVGCNFCSTSALFGGKGKFVNFYETGGELFDVMRQMEEELGVNSFFILDENFLLHRKRALKLLELMEAHEKTWSLLVFSSARVLNSYTMEQLASLGISWVWMGVEGENTQYRKLGDIDTHELITRLQSHGIRVLGSSIIGLENHTPENINDVIAHAVSHNTDFHQFMLYTPNPGTPLYREHKKAGTLLPESEFPVADAHGQYRFNYRHAHIRNDEEEQFLLNAFRRDFEENGPSIARTFRTLLSGWIKYKNHPEERIRNRFRFEVRQLRTTYAAAVWAMIRWYKNDAGTKKKMKTLLKDLCAEFGWKTRMFSRLGGMFIYFSMLRENRRLENGETFEPETFLEKNPAALALERKHAAKSKTSEQEIGLAPAPATCTGR